MKKYVYNPWFLPTWMKQNNIKKAHLLKVLDLKGKTNLDIWLGVSKKQRDDQAKGIDIVPPPIPLQHIATICNHYHIDIRNFFLMPGDELEDCSDINNEMPLSRDNEKETAAETPASETAAEVAYLKIIMDQEEQIKKLTDELVRLSEAHRDALRILLQKPQKEQPSNATDEPAVAWMAAEEYPEPEPD